MLKSAEELANEYSQKAEIFKSKSEELKKFAVEVPRIIRILDAGADMFGHTAIELRKFSQFHPDPINYPDYKGENYFNLQTITNLSVPSQIQTYSVGTTVSGLVNESSSSVMHNVVNFPGYESNYFGNLPASFNQLKFTDELCELLNTIDPRLAEIWRAAWDQLTLGKIDSFKNSSANARTVVDKISWLTDYKHLETLPWFVPDEKGKPIRAVRYGWIQYGDDLPNDLRNDSTLDENYKVLNSGYSVFGKYVHDIEFNVNDKAVLEASLVSIESSLIKYLNVGSERLQLRIKELNEQKK